MRLRCDYQAILVTTARCVAQLLRSRERTKKVARRSGRGMNLLRRRLHKCEGASTVNSTLREGAGCAYDKRKSQNNRVRGRAATMGRNSANLQLGEINPCYLQRKYSPASADDHALPG